MGESNLYVELIAQECRRVFASITSDPVRTPSNPRAPFARVVPVKKSRVANPNIMH